MQCGVDKPLQIMSKTAVGNNGEPLGLVESFSYMSGSQPPLYPGGDDPYSDGPDAGPIQQYALPGQPSAFKWIRGVGCIAAIPGADMSAHDWNNPAKFIKIPDAVCAAYSQSVHKSMPAYIDASGKVIPYRNQSIPGTSPQENYAYSVPVQRWVCDPATLQCSKSITKNKGGFDTQAQCDAACTKWSCNGTACVADKKGTFLTQTECQASGCGKWSCIAGKYGQCEQVAKGKYDTKAACEGALECAGYFCDIPLNGLMQCIQKVGATRSLAECKASGCGNWTCSSTPGVCVQSTKGTFTTKEQCEAPTSVCRNTTNDNQCTMRANGTCDVVNKAYNKATCVPYKRGCYSTTAPQCRKDTDCHTRDNSEGPYYSDTGGAYWCQYINVPGSGDVDMACANPAYQCTADSDCSCSTIPLTGVCYTPCVNKKFDKTGVNSASAKCEWQGVLGSPQCKCSRPPPH